MSNPDPNANSKWIPPSPDKIGAFLPDYKVTEARLRSNGVAEYTAWQRDLNRNVVIRIIPSALDGEATERFESQARVMANFHYSGILSIYDFGQIEAILYYQVLEAFDGVKLDDYLEERGGSLDRDEAIEILTALLDSIEYAHRQEVVHGSVEARNLLISPQGRVKLTGFGLGEPGGKKTEDLEAAGAVFYRMLTGETLVKPWNQKRSLRTGTDQRLENLILGALIDNADSFQSAAVLQAGIENVRTQSHRNRKHYRWSLVVAAMTAAGAALVYLIPRFKDQDTTDLPGDAQILTFQQGIDSGFGSYNSTRHVRILASTPDQNETAGRVAADGNSNGETILQSLLLFDDIFGNSPGKIPPEAIIQKAVLTMNVTNGGHIPGIFQMATEWDYKTLTFSNARLNGNELPGIQVDDLEAFATPEAMPPHGEGGVVVDIDVTEGVQKWSSGRPNFGWVLQPRSTNAWGADGLDVVPENRPELKVSFTVKDAQRRTE